jgi:hypothetical protein
VHKYLKKQSVVNYHDRGMVKWAGFYLSEHTGRIKTDNRLDQIDERYGKLTLSKALQKKIDLAVLQGTGQAVKVMTLGKVNRKPKQSWDKRGDAS